MLYNTKARIIWLTGLSGAGKTTLAMDLRKSLIKFFNREDIFHLDGDDMRETLCKDLGFSIKDRNENIRRAIEMIKILSSQNYFVIASFISPILDVRESIRNIFKVRFYEIYIKCEIETCIKRDVKGLYKNKPPNMTGISSKYEPPPLPDLIIDTSNTNFYESRCKLFNFVVDNVS